MTFKYSNSRNDSSCSQSFGAVIFGSGYLNIKNMVQKGIWMNLTSIFILTLFVYFTFPWLWGLES
jgi:di/tricarboxylate transporter